jgi:hypothetical protein
MAQFPGATDRAVPYHSPGTSFSVAGYDAPGYRAYCGTGVKFLLDENLPHQIRLELSGQDKIAGYLRVGVPPPEAFGKPEPGAACSLARAWSYELTAEPQYIRPRYQGGAAFVHASKDAPNLLICPAPLEDALVRVESTPVRVSKGHF